MPVHDEPARIYPRLVSWPALGGTYEGEGDERDACISGDAEGTIVEMSEELVRLIASALRADEEGATGL